MPLTCVVFARYPNFPHQAGVQGNISMNLSLDDQWGEMLTDGACSISVFLGTEQPESCRACGMRTNFIVLGMLLQVHECPACAKVYYLEFGEELFEEGE